jgi:hypothetical protein
MVRYKSETIILHKEYITFQTDRIHKLFIDRQLLFINAEKVQNMEAGIEYFDKMSAKKLIFPNYVCWLCSLHDYVAAEPEKHVMLSLRKSKKIHNLARFTTRFSSFYRAT